MIFGNKRVKGIKRHILLDKNGFLIAVLVTVANMNDSKTETLLISSLEINAGARLEYHTVRGDYLDHKVMDPATGLPYTTINEPKIKMDDNWCKKAFSLNVVYKMTHKFGLLGEANYKEQRGHLESYFSGNNPNLKNCTFVS